MLLAIEEMSELTKELLKNINRNENNTAQIIEETADVEIMLEQIKLIYGFDKSFELIKGIKLSRLAERLG